MEIFFASFQSADYYKSIELRYSILRKPLGMVYTPEQLASEFDQFHFVAKINQEVVGVIVLQKLENNIAKMRQVAIDNKLQRKGVGTKMIDYVENWCKINEVQKITLHARENAIPFYEKLNYYKVGNPFVEVGLNHSEMEKKIN
jgi:N-acetylglutamate synthase-like GNAT family acetyltransferase